MQQQQQQQQQQPFPTSNAPGVGGAWQPLTSLAAQSPSEIVYCLKSLWCPSWAGRKQEVLQALERMIAPNCTIEGFTPTGDVLVGPAGFYAFWNSWMAALPDFNWVTVDVVAQGARAFGYSEGVGTFTGDFYGIKGTAKRAPIRFIARYEFGAGAAPGAPLAVTNMVVTSTALDWLRTVGAPLSLPGLRATQALAPQALAGQKIAPQQQQQQQQQSQQSQQLQQEAAGLPVAQQAGGVGVGGAQQQAGFASGGLPHQQLPRY